MGVSLGSQRFRSRRCGTAELWKRASPVHEITNHSDCKTKELPSCGVRCNMTSPCWLRGAQSPFIWMNLSIDGAGLVGNVSITHRTLKHGIIWVGCSKRDKCQETEFALCPQSSESPLNAWSSRWLQATHLWIVWALFRRVWDASKLMTRAHGCSYFNLQVRALCRDQSVAIRAPTKLVHANLHLCFMSICRLALSHPGGAQGSVISLIVKAKCTAARTGQDHTCSCDSLHRPFITLP